MTDDRTWVDDAPAGPDPYGLALPPRYALDGRLGQGATSDVWRVRDTLLDQTLAMKVLRPSLVGSPRARARFVNESKVTAGLQHPSIVAVHDRGALPDGRPWFTMTEVRGRTLSAVLAGRSADTPVRPSVGVFAQAAQAVAYAHTRGVVHRDLKPDNIMVGAFGAVLVTDWGLARTAAVTGDGGDDADVVTSPGHTRIGNILGTPAYMPPEQARGDHDAVGPWSDVYALGAVLYEILAHQPPYRAGGAAPWRQVLAAPPAPVDTVAPRTPPADLAALCTAAMARDPADRPDAAAFAARLQRWLDGEAQRRRALDLLAAARRRTAAIDALQAQARALRERARQLAADLSPHDPETRKAPVWAVEDQAARIEKAAAVQEAGWLQQVHGALNLADLDVAHALLADHYHRVWHRADAAGRPTEAAHAEALLRAHDRGRYQRFLDGRGSLSLATSPPATVHAVRFVERRRRRVAVDVGPLGTTPLAALELPSGSYLLDVGTDATRVRLHVDLAAGDDLVHTGPDGAPRVLVLPPPVPPDRCVVPEGWFVCGGDPDAAESLPRRRVWLPTFVIQRDPVTNAAYAAFLDAMGADAGRLAPAPPAAASQVAVGLVHGPDGWRCTGDPGWEPDAPVVLVDHAAARAYAAWRATIDGVPWRLPHEWEWEKAARGVDGRRFPWGDVLDPTWCRNLHAQPGEPSRVPVDRYPVDTSPYGVRGLAGNTRDLCANHWTAGGPAVVDGRLHPVAPPADAEFLCVRGGCWAGTPRQARLAGRFVTRPGERFTTTGFRLAYTVEVG